METYLTLLYVTLEQELALKDLFKEKGWTYCKPDLSVMTEKVGPVEHPQSFKTKSGGIITYCQLPEGGGSVKKRKTKVVTKKDATKPDVADIKVEISTEEEGLPSQLNDVKSNVVIENVGPDDGDFDDDFADDLDTYALENDTSDTEIHKLHKTRDRKPAAKLANSNYGTRSGKNGVNVKAENRSVDEEETERYSPRRRKVAVDTEVEMEAMAEEERQREETELKPVVLVRNMVTKPTKKQAPGTNLKCSMCPRQYKLQYYLDKHYVKAHDPNNPPVKHKQKSSMQSGQCDICGSVFKRSDYLRLHKRRVHQGIKQVAPIVISTCEVCGSTFKRRDHLREHILVKHSNSKLPYPCEMCEKSFIRPRFREVHVNRDHLKERPYICTYCDKGYFCEYSVKKHMESKVCHPDTVKRFKCIQCEKTFLYARNLEMHMTALHFGGAYRCACGEVVKWLGSVAKHKRKCQIYQDYVAVNGEDENKLCNIIEVPYNDVLVENTTETDSLTTGKEDSIGNGNDAEQDVEDDIEQDVEEDIEQDVEEDIEQDMEEDIEQDVEEDIEQDTDGDREQDAEQDCS